MYKSTTTIDDVFRLALPAQTQLLVGAELLNRPVSWACSLRPSPPAFPKLDGNELALIDLEDLRRLDPQMRLDRVIRSLQQARVSAVAVLAEGGGNPDQAGAAAAAASHHLVLFQLPQGVSLTQVERSVIRLIVDRAGYIAQRAAELQRELSQAALDGGGLPKIAARLYSFVQQPVILLSETGAVNTCAGLDRLPSEQRKALLDSLPNLTTLRSWTATQPPTALNGASTVSGMVMLAGDSWTWAAVCSSIRGRP